MEPLTAGAIAIGIATKALEKTGDKVGETLWDRNKFIGHGTKKSAQRLWVSLCRLIDYQN
ncbi:MAG: hypothetical protein PUP93_22620 [Rhizonema sp. NSF051]|nr:hypothetical protein [Rhizonema sp. NSF051]